ncbi:MAG: NFYB/HAP3 family transcription factor subunit [Nanoarchaeales archaeon]|nr:NFYB/HAP3 family transcription factor subunit [Nanoarchaeales archaeon]
MHHITLTSVEEILKHAGADKISPDATDCLREFLEDEVQKILKKSIQVTQLSRNSRTMGKHVEMCLTN